MPTFNLANRIKVTSKASNIDETYGPYDTVSEANSAIVEGLRDIGRTVIIKVGSAAIEYWWKAGTTDADLVQKNIAFISPFTFNSSSVTGIQSAGNGALGTNSLAIGILTVASGAASFSSGGISRAEGNNSIAVGGNALASGNSAAAFGTNTDATGDSSTAMGYNTDATGDSSTAMGYSTTASGDYSTAMGGFTVASEDYSTAMGADTTASGLYSTAMGVGTTTSGFASTAMGVGTEASGDNSTAMGSVTSATAQSSIAMGESTIASGNISTVMGTQTIARDYASLVTGQNNLSGSVATSATIFSLLNPAFVIGNGLAINNRSDAFKVLFNGTTTIAGNVTAPSFIGELNGTINTATTAVTQATSSNDQKLATTAFVQNAISSFPGGLAFQTTWNATTDNPNLSSATPTNGQFWIVDVAGTTTLDGISSWGVGDWALYIVDGASSYWQKVDNSSSLTGSGTGNKITKWSGSGTSTTVTDSIITDDGSSITIGGNVSASNLSGTNTGDQVLPTLTTLGGLSTSGGIISGNLKVTGELLDSTGDTGASGQLLSSTGSGTNWVTPSAASSGVTSIITGDGLSGGTITSTGTISHADTSSQSSVGNSGNIYIQDITLDTFGHVTGLASETVSLAGLGFYGATNANYITNNLQIDNGRGYITGASTTTLTNKSGSNNQWTNDAGYTSFAEPAIFSNGGTPQLANNVTATATRNLIGAMSATNGTAGKIAKWINTSTVGDSVISESAAGVVSFSGYGAGRLVTDASGNITASTLGGGAFEEITESGKTGIRRTGANANFYGDIGTEAVDLSYSFTSSAFHGATGDYSTAMGNSTEASRDNSTAMGHGTIASGNSSTAMGNFATASGFASTAMGNYTSATGDYSTAMGNSTTASDYGSLVIGRYNSSGSTVTNSATTFNVLNTAFVIGNGVDGSNISDAFKVLFNGNTTIGNNLIAGGNVTATGDVIAYSDARVKENVTTIDNALNKVTKLRGVTYTRKDVKDKETKMGVIAQEVLKVIPEIVHKDDKGMYAVAYGNMNGLLIEAIKELKAEIDELKSKL